MIPGRLARAATFDRRGQRLGVMSNQSESGRKQSTHDLIEPAGQESRVRETASSGEPGGTGAEGCRRGRGGNPITIEVIVYAPTAFFHCMHCELVWREAGAAPDFRREQLQSSIPEDLKEDYQRLSDWVRGLREIYGDQVRFRIVDAASLEGWWKSLRYGVRRYPAVIVDGKEKSIGPDFDRAEEIIRRRLGGGSA